MEVWQHLDARNSRRLGVPSDGVIPYRGRVRILGIETIRNRVDYRPPPPPGLGYRFNARKGVSS